MTMPNAATAYSDDLLQRARAVRLVCFDVDGTLTDGRLIYDSDGRELKAFHAHDGQGLTLLRDAGFAIELITARLSPVAELRARELRVGIHTGIKNKLRRVQELVAAQGIELAQVAFMGDDYADYAVMGAVGLAVAPADAHPWAAERAHWRTQARGGFGAARELCDLLLEAHGFLPGILSPRTIAQESAA